MNDTPEATREVVFRDLRLDLASGVAFRGESPIHVTGSEFRLLVALMSEPDKVCSRQQLIALAIAGGAIVTERTIDVHVAALRRKLGLPIMIETVRRQGYRMRGS